MFNFFKFGRTFSYFLKGYSSILNLYPKTNDTEEIRKDVYNVASDFRFVVKTQEEKYEQQKSKAA